MGIFGGKGIKINADRDYKEGDEVRTHPPARHREALGDEGAEVCAGDLRVQVLVSYGPKSNVEFLEDHGFVPQRSPEDGASWCGARGADRGRGWLAGWPM